MKLTAERVHVALPVIDRIISERRPLTVKAAYRMARLHAKLLPEFRLLEQRRDALICAYEYKAVPEGAKEGAKPVPTVPADKVPEFHANWAATVKDEIEVDVQPISIHCLGPAHAESPVTAAEMLLLGELLVDESDQVPGAAPLPKAA